MKLLKNREATKENLWTEIIYDSDFLMGWFC